MPAVLRDVLVEHRMNGSGEGLVFERANGRPFSTHRPHRGCPSRRPTRRTITQDKIDLLRRLVNQINSQNSSSASRRRAR
jgi:hypothetical protein